LLLPVIWFEPELSVKLEMSELSYPLSETVG